MIAARRPAARRAGPRSGRLLAAIAVSLSLSLSLSLSMACSRSPSTGDPRPAPPSNRGGSVAIDAAPPIDATSACVAECVRSRQMQATSIEYIEQDCARLCAMPQPPALP